MFTELVEGTLGAPADEAQRPLYICGCPLCSGSAGNSPAELERLQFGILPDQPANGANMPLAASAAELGALMSGSQWAATGAKTVITFSFANTASIFSGGSASYSGSLQEFSAQDKALTRTLLGTIEAVCNVSFVEVADNASASGQVRYAYSQAPNDMGYAGFAFFPSSTATGGDVWIGSAQSSAQWDFYRPDLILHETLHAIGLKHPFEGAAVLNKQTDIIPNTVMSYSAMAGSASGALSSYPAEPMVLDVAALQAMYGVASHNQGDTVYTLSAPVFQSGFHTLWDSAGYDMLDASAIGHGVTLDLRDGGSSDIGVRVSANASFGTPEAPTMSSTVYTNTLSLASGTHIESAIGTPFDDVLISGELGSALFGGRGNDLLIGGAGLDVAAYHGSIANFKIERSGDYIGVVDRLGGQGADSLRAIEKLRFDDLTVDLGVQDIAATVTGARLHAVVELYVGFFNRVPDGEGMAYWLEQLNDGMTTATMADCFYTAALQYSALTGYSSSMKNEDFVKVIYQNVLGRSSVDPEGLAYWSNALGNGAETRGSLLEAILGSAHTFKGNSQYGYVADLLANKFEVGKMFSVDMGLTWNTAEQSIEQGMKIAAAVTPTDIVEAVRLMGVIPEDVNLTA